MSVLFTADRRARALWARLAFVAGAALASGFAAPSWVSVPLALIAAGVTVESALRGSGRNWIEYIAYACGGTLATLALVGLGLDVVPGGITRISWSIALGIIAAVVVAWSYRTRPRGEPTASVPHLNLTNLRQSSWYAGALVVVVAAIGISVHSTRVAQHAPAALSVVSESAGGAAVVQVSAGTAGGSFELTSSGPASTRSFTLDDGQTRRFTVAAPPDQRTTVTLLRLHPSAGPLHVVVYGSAIATSRAGSAGVTR